MSIEDKLVEEKTKIDELLATDPMLSVLKADRIDYKREKYYAIQEQILKEPILTESGDRDTDSFVSLRDLSIAKQDRQVIYLLKRIEALEARVNALEHPITEIVK